MDDLSLFSFIGSAGRGGAGEGPFLLKWAEPGLRSSEVGRGVRLHSLLIVQFTQVTGHSCFLTCKKDVRVTPGKAWKYFPETMKDFRIIKSVDYT